MISDFVGPWSFGVLLVHICKKNSICRQRGLNGYSVLFVSSLRSAVSVSINTSKLCQCYFMIIEFWITGDFFEEWNEITPQTHIRKFEELMAWGQVSCWGAFLTSIGSSGLMQTLWMSEMTPSKTPVLKPLVLQIFLCGLELSFCYLLRKFHL